MTRRAVPVNPPSMEELRPAHRALMRHPVALFWLKLGTDNGRRSVGHALPDGSASLEKWRHSERGLMRALHCIGNRYQRVFNKCLKFHKRGKT